MFGPAGRPNGGRIWFPGIRTGVSSRRTALPCWSWRRRPNEWLEPDPSRRRRRATGDRRRSARYGRGWAGPDAEGGLWVTLYRPDGLVRIAADGRVDRTIDDHLASTFDAPTNLVFVGEHLDRAVVANVGGRHLVDRRHRGRRSAPPVPGGTVMGRFDGRNVIVSRAGDRSRHRGGIRRGRSPRLRGRRARGRAR